MWSWWLVVLAACGRVGFDDGYRKHIAIDHTQVVGGPLADFPVLVSIVDPDLAAAAQPDGSDIAFGALSHELEHYDLITGTLLAWVKVPSVSSIADTTFEVSAGAAATNNPVDVWSSNYVAVWHMSDDPSGAAPQIRDSSASTVNGTTSGAMTPDQRVAGQIGWAVSLDGVDDDIGLGTTPELDVGGGSFTLSLWVFVPAVVGMWDSPFAKGGAAADCRGYDIELGADVWTAHVADGATFVTGTFSQTPVLARWISLAAVFDPGNELAVYADGQLVQAVPLVGFMSAASAAPADIGGAGDGCNFTSRFAGLVDEVRVASVARTSGWIATELADQSSPQTFARLVEP